MNTEQIYKLVLKAREGDYESAMKVVNHYKGFTNMLMSKNNVHDKVSCLDEVSEAILKCILNFK